MDTLHALLTLDPVLIDFSVLRVHAQGADKLVLRNRYLHIALGLIPSVTSPADENLHLAPPALSPRCIALPRLCTHHTFRDDLFVLRAVAKSLVKGIVRPDPISTILRVFFEIIVYATLALIHVREALLFEERGGTLAADAACAIHENFLSIKFLLCLFAIQPFRELN